MRHRDSSCSGKGSLQAPPSNSLIWPSRDTGEDKSTWNAPIAFLCKKPKFLLLFVANQSTRLFEISVILSPLFLGEQREQQRNNPADCFIRRCCEMHENRIRLVFCVWRGRWGLGWPRARHQLLQIVLGSASLTLHCYVPADSDFLAGMLKVLSLL